MQFEQTGTGAVGALDTLRAQYAAVPKVLKDRRQWVLWIRLPADERGKFGKKPVSADGSGRVASPHDWTTWATFDEALARLASAPPMSYGGLGFMLTKNDPFMVVDFDDISACNPAALDGRVGYQNYVADLPTYVEMSPSGRGWHVWTEAHLDGAASEPLKAFAIDFLCHSVFVTVTGRSVGGAGGHILPGQHFVTYMDDFIRDRRLQVAVNLEVDSNKPLYLTDEELYNQAVGFNSHFHPRYHGLDGHLPGEWSHTFYNVVGTLDKLTGDPAQIRRLIMWSGLVTRSPPDKVGIDRVRKAERIFNSVLLKVRADNKVHLIRNQDPNTCGWAHGKGLWEAIEAEKVRRVEEAARAEAQRIADEAAAAEAYRLHYEKLGATGRVVEGYSATAEGVLGRFDMFDWEHRKMTLPPGRMGRFVEAVMASSYISDDRFATPTALAALSGIVARSYATEGGAAPNLNFLMLGKPGTGKSSAMEAWGSLFADTMANPAPQHAGNRGNAAPKLSDHIIRGKMSSGHGFHMSVQEKPSAVWFLDEAAAQYMEMVDGKDKNGLAVLSVYNQLYDKAKHGEVLSPPSSMATRQSGMLPVPKPAIATLWACPPTSIEITTDALVSGLLSRLIIVQNPSNGQLPRRDVANRPRSLPEELKWCLYELVDIAAFTNRYYEPNPTVPYDRLVTIDTSQVTEMAADFEAAAMGIVIEGNAHSLPAHYTAFARIASSAMRLASVLAIVENPHWPVVTGHMYRWAAGYVVQNLVLLLSGMDSGETGAKASDEWRAVKRCYERLSRKPKTYAGVKRGELQDAMKELKVFYASRLGSNKSVAACLDLMVAEGVLIEDRITGARGRPTRTVVMDESHHLWET